MSTGNAGGSATGGPATSGPPSDSTSLNNVPIMVQPGGPMKNGGPCTMTFTAGKWLLSANDGRSIWLTPTGKGPSSNTFGKLCSVLNLNPDQIKNLVNKVEN